MDKAKNPLVRYFLSHKHRVYKKGQIILRAYMSAPDLYYIEKGHVQVYTLLPSGVQKIYVFYKAGEIFPIVMAFNKINKNLFYEAMDDVVVYKISDNDFLGFVSGKPKLLLEVIHRIVDIHNIYVDRVDNLEYTNAYSRIIARLLFLAKRFGKQDENTVIIQIPVTHADIANSIAMTRETASREIEKLKKKGLVKIKNRLLVILDTEKLEKELNNSTEKRYL